MHVCACLYMYACLCTCVSHCACLCLPIWRSEVNFYCFSPCVLRQCLSQSLKLPNTASKPPQPEDSRYTAPHLAFMWVPGIPTQILMLVQQPLYPRSCLHSSAHTSFQCQLLFEHTDAPFYKRAKPLPGGGGRGGEHCSLCPDFISSYSPTRLTLSSVDLNRNDDQSLLKSSKENRTHWLHTQ